MQSDIDKLKARIHGNGKTKRTPLMDFADVARELGCLGDMLGREFEIFDGDGKLLYRVKQKPINVKQYALIAQSVFKLKQEDWKNKSEFWGKMLGGKRGR